MIQVEAWLDRRSDAGESGTNSRSGPPEDRSLSIGICWVCRRSG